MIELFKQDIRTIDRNSSKGNQLKWEKDGTWYKADYAGYEGLSEYVVSCCLIGSSLTDQEFAIYEPETIKYKSVRYNGVSSKNFLSDDWQIITLERLYQNVNGRSLMKDVWKISDVGDRFDFLVNEIEKITGLEGFAVYLNKLFTIDAFFLNEDRHFHNIALLMNGAGGYDFCPIFDNGAALLSDTSMEYPLEEETIKLMGSVKSKSISTSFDEQLDISESRVGNNLKFSIDKKLLWEKIDGVPGYSRESKQRLKEVLVHQIRKYGYLK